MFVGSVDDASRAWAQTHAVDHGFEPSDRGFEVVRRVVDGGHHQVARSDQAFASDFFLPRANHHFVNTALAGFARFAETDLHAGQGLQFDGHVLHDVAAPGAVVQAQQKTAALADTAAVLDHAGQPSGEPVDKTGQFVGGVVFKNAQINPGFDDRTVGPHIRSAQITHAQNGDIGKGHKVND